MMCCKEKSQEDQCCVMANKEKIIPCVFAFVNFAIATAVMVHAFHCLKED